jgi:hypothetical protein
VRVGAPPRSALQIANALGAQPGARGQLLLRETRGLPQPPEPCAELGVLPSAQVAFTSLVTVLSTYSPATGDHGNSVPPST